MAGNTFGKTLQLTTFGESHGEAIGGIIDGFPAGLKVDFEAINRQMARRKPGQSNITTQRKESDQVHFLSGIFEGKTLGTPIGFVIWNKDAKSKDYSHIKDKYRPSHADKVYQEKYGLRDYRGGGRSSARETACRVVAGALAAQLLPQTKIWAYVSAVGSLALDENATLTPQTTDENLVRCPHAETAQAFEAEIRKARKAGDTLGGIITTRISGVPSGLGQPVFNKLNADLAQAMLSINAVKGFEIGSGFAGTLMRGSAHNDIIEESGRTATNHSGGVQGGISNGEEIYFKVAFKPVATLMQKQNSVNEKGQAVTVQGKGRHDPCVVPRAVPIVESMAALVLADHFLQMQTDKL
jgi:chorismate synthase